uniref:BTB domain-containing protein n=1 Tax=Panagrolaimus davidi TaxID=227884 RepID=A0A914QMG3_9BILA
MEKTKRNYFWELHIEKFETFKTQDPDTGDFDVVFEIGEKNLYAHKSKLCEVSSTFNVMLSDRWTTSPNEPNPIKDYTFDDFKEFITFIYSGECKFTHDNIFAMTDIAEFYDVKVFKKACENYLLSVERNLENVYQMFELSYKYSLEDLKKSLFDFVSQNFLNFLHSEQFQALSYSVVYDIVKLNQSKLSQEKLFETVYKWAETKAIQEQKSDKNINLDETMFIKELLSNLLPFFRFQMMDYEFLAKFVVFPASEMSKFENSFLFSGNELSDILLEAQYLVTFIDENGKMAKCILDCADNDKMLSIIQSKKYEKQWWLKIDESFLPLPLANTDLLMKSKGFQFYLTWYPYGNDYNLGCIPPSDCWMQHRVMAKVYAEEGFERDSCKIV